MEIRDHGSRFRRRFTGKCVGIRLQLPMTEMARSYIVFIRGAGADAWYEDLPYAAIAQPHGMTPRIPVIEVANDTHNFGIWRPHREADARNSRRLGDVSSKRVVALVVCAFT